MKELEVLLEEQDIEFDADKNRIMCFPHIINICNTHVLDSITNIKLADDDDDDPPPIDIQTTEALSFQQACGRDPVARGRVNV